MYNLNLTEQEINTIGKSLASQPYGEVALLVQNIVDQINKQKEQNGNSTGTEPAAVE